MAEIGVAPHIVVLNHMSGHDHMHAVALHMLYYNFVRIHKTLRMTPAMAADQAALGNE